MEVTRYRLLSNKREGTWSMRGGNALKDGRIKSINYYPGSDSIFDQDNKDTSVKPKSVVFRYNDTVSDPAVEVIVANQDKSLIDYLEAHPFNGRFYKRYDPEREALEQLEKYQKVERALSYIGERDNKKSKAIGLAVLGFEYLSFSPVQVKTLLREKAIEEPQLIIGCLEASDYQNRYKVSLGYSCGILGSNSSHSAVIWLNNGGEIIQFAKGENPIDKLTDYLNGKSEDSRAFLKELNLRLNVVFVEDRADKKDLLTSLRWEYKNKFNKDVPIRYINDATWIDSKLKEESVE